MNIGISKQYQVIQYRSAKRLAAPQLSKTKNLILRSLSKIALGQKQIFLAKIGLMPRKPDDATASTQPEDLCRRFPIHLKHR